jgi:hypothetical protein
MSTSLTASIADYVVTEDAPETGFWSRMFDAIVEGRTRDAQRLLRRHELSLGLSSLDEVIRDRTERADSIRATF